MEERWSLVDEIVAYLGVSREMANRWIEGRGLPGRRIGKFWKFKRKEVDEWVRAGRASDALPSNSKVGEG